MKWSDGCTDCSVHNGVLKYCNTRSTCKYTKCLPVCTEFADTMRQPPENCMAWYDGCNNCDISTE
jgi:hypothetical protein